MSNMKKVDEVLAKIIRSTRTEAVQLDRYQNPNGFLTESEALSEILTLFKSIMPEELLDKPTTGESYSLYHKAWNDYRTELLKRLDEAGG